MHINQIYRWCLIPRSYELLELHVHLLIGLFFPSLIHIMICTWMCVYISFNYFKSTVITLYAEVEFCLDFAWNSKCCITYQCLNHIDPLSSHQLDKVVYVDKTLVFGLFQVHIHRYVCPRTTHPRAEEKPTILIMTLIKKILSFLCIFLNVYFHSIFFLFP